MAFFSLIIYTALIYIRPQDIFPEMEGLPVVRIMATVAVFFAFMENKFNLGKLFSNDHAKYMVYFSVATVASHLSVFNVTRSWNAAIFMGQIVLLYLLIINLLDTVNKVKTYTAVLVILTVILSFQGIQQFHTGVGWGGQTAFIETLERDDDGEILRSIIRVRGIGIFEDPNDYGQALVMAIPLLFTLVYGYGANFFVKLLSIASLSSLLYTVYLTNSRGGYVAIMGIFATYFLLKYGAVKGVTPGTIAIVLLILVGPSRAGSLFTMDSSGRGRVEAWSAGIQMLKTHLFFGVGKDNFTEYHERTAHNTFVLTFAETGLFGSYAWIGLFYAYFKDIFRVRQIKDLKDPDNIKRIHEALLVSMIGFLTGAFFLSRTWVPIPYMWIALGSAVSRILQKDNPGIKAPFKVADVTRIFLYTLLGILFVYVNILVLRTFPVQGAGEE